MKKHLFPLALAFFLFVSAEVRTQTSAEQAPTIKMTAEQSHTVKELMKDFSFPKAAATEFKVGDDAPANVKLESFPEQISNKVTPLKSHKFFLSGQTIVVVDKDNKVAEVIE